MKDLGLTALIGHVTLGQEEIYGEFRGLSVLYKIDLSTSPISVKSQGSTRVWEELSSEASARLLAEVRPRAIAALSEPPYEPSWSPEDPVRPENLGEE